MFNELAYAFGQDVRVQLYLVGPEVIHITLALTLTLIRIILMLRALICFFDPAFNSNPNPNPNPNLNHNTLTLTRTLTLILNVGEWHYRT